MDINALLGRFCDNYAISAVYDHSEAECKYMLCNFLPGGVDVPEDFTVLAVPATTWAVFDALKMEIQDMWRRIWAEWFPASGYEVDGDIHFEMYYGLARHENGFGEIWVPVRKK